MILQQVQRYMRVRGEANIDSTTVNTRPRAVRKGQRRAVTRQAPLRNASEPIQPRALNLSPGTS